jgi:NADPH:quinone reductase-like Zn-dependent oxidoreductase
VQTSGAAGARRALHILTDIAQPIEAGRFTLAVARTYSLDQIAEAQRESEGGHVRGKLVVVI